MISIESGVVPDRPDELSRMLAVMGSPSSSRVIDAPRAEVFQIWTDPVRLAQWLGPYGLTDPVCEMELHRGGAYRIVLFTPGGTRYAVSFEEEGDKTRLTLEAPLVSLEVCRAILMLDQPGP